MLHRAALRCMLPYLRFWILASASSGVAQISLFSGTTGHKVVSQGRRGEWEPKTQEGRG